ncbi:MAG: hypothetical protein V2J51_04345 [Erythrobacter sp.]|jgi:hypothetical protein|nr:hypothetical protein [Erythrobacter sp.]
MKAAFCLPLLVLTGWCAAALAQPVPGNQPPGEAPEPGEIVVRGDAARKDRPAAINRFIRAVIRPEPVGQYARFDAPVCPSAIGFAEDQGEAIEARIRAVADAAEIAVAPAGCQPNLHLVLVENGEDAIRVLRSRRPGAFGRMPHWQRDRIARGPGPVYNWHAVYPVSSDGGGNRAVLNGGGTGAVGSGAALLGEPAYNAGMTNVKSRLLQPVKQQIGHGIVLVERAAATRATALQLADFAAMRGLLSAREGSEDLAGVETILRLFESGSAGQDHPPSLTQWDLALLTALYRAPPDMNADRQRSAMARTFARLLDEAEE